MNRGRVSELQLPVSQIMRVNCRYSVVHSVCSMPLHDGRLMCSEHIEARLV